MNQIIANKKDIVYVIITPISRAAKRGPNNGIVFNIEYIITTIISTISNPTTVIEAGITIVNNHPITKTTNINLNDLINNISV